MIAIQLTFPAGRFHATPWGRHVNEGAVEWPPSPWRLLRALIATWKSKAPGLAGDIEMRGLLENLSQPPEFSLPPATFSHTRQYMPWFKKGPGDRTLIFDSFVAVGKDTPVVLRWPDLALQEKEARILTALLPLLGTLGRSESWCEARLLEANESATVLVNCIPVTGSSVDGEVVRVLGVDPSSAFQNDKNPCTFPSSGKGKSKTTERFALYDPDWHICMETLWLHQNRMSMPPGSRWLEYVRRKDALAQPKPFRAENLSNRPSMQVARFALDSAVKPLVTETLRIAEDARFTLMGIFGRQNMRNGIKGRSIAFSGKFADGSRVSNHGHCYYLPTDEDFDGRIDHLTIFSSDGFSPEELRSLDSLRVLGSRDRMESGHELRAILLGTGRASDYAPGPLQPSKSWLSATPFLAPDHPKSRGRYRDTDQGGTDPKRFLEAQVRKEIARWMARNGISLAIESIRISWCQEEGVTRRFDPKNAIYRERPIQFQRFRRKRGDDGGRRHAGFFHLEFPSPIKGPLALGYSSHFGMGLFMPVL